MKWHAGGMEYAVARYFQWWRLLMMTEYEIGRGRADLVFVSPAGYLTEVEIKISRADWKSDLFKEKWNHERPYVNRFFYAIPETLKNKIPEWVPAWAGILVVHRNYWDVHEMRAAQRKKAPKVTDAIRLRILTAGYQRFWHQEMSRRATALWNPKVRVERDPWRF